MVFVVVVVALFAAPTSAVYGWPAPPSRRAACSLRAAPALCRLHWQVRRVWRLEHARHIPQTRYWYSAERHPGQAPYTARRTAWRRRGDRVARIPVAPWPRGWLADALCVHHYEGAWTDPGAPYWGGMQEDLAFQRAYGAEYLRRYGTADHWPPHDQLVAAYRAWRVRGWTPWPNTARTCGLL